MLKELIINSDYDYYANKNLICYASNNSNDSSWEYKLFHNCEWQVAFEDDQSVQSFDFDVDFLCIAKRDLGVKTWHQATQILTTLL